MLVQSDSIILFSFLLFLLGITVIIRFNYGLNVFLMWLKCISYGENLSAKIKTFLFAFIPNKLVDN